MQSEATEAAEAAEAEGPVLVVGTGRCGSTLLSDMLSAHPDVLCLSELFISLGPDAFRPGVIDGQSYWDMLTTPRPYINFLVKHDLVPPELLYPIHGDGRFVGRPLPPIIGTTIPHLTEDPDGLFAELEDVVPKFAEGTAADHHRRLFCWLASRFARPLVVERSGASLGFLAGMAAAFPRARFVHIYRDGSECALSMREHHIYRLNKLASQFSKLIGFDPYAEDRPFDAGAVPEQMRPLLPDRFDRDAYIAFSFSAEDFGWVWSALMVEGMKTLETIPPERLHTVSFEALLESPAQTLTALGDFIGLEDVDDWAARASRGVQPSRVQNRVLSLGPEEQKALSRSTRIGARSLRRGIAR